MFDKSKADQEKRMGRTIYTQVLPFTKFTVAEDYHQKYYLRGKAKTFALLNFSDHDVIYSDLACHLNALVSGNCTEQRGLEIIEEARAQTKNEELVKALSGYAGSFQGDTCGGV